MLLYCIVSIQPHRMYCLHTYNTYRVFAIGFLYTFKFWSAALLCMHACNVDSQHATFYAFISL